MSLRSLCWVAFAVCIVDLVVLVIVLVQVIPIICVAVAGYGCGSGVACWVHDTFWRRRRRSFVSSTAFAAQPCSPSQLLLLGRCQR